MDHTLDAAALHAVLSRLEPRSLLACSLASSTLATAANASMLWQPLLQQDFGLFFQAAGSQGVDLQRTYKQLATSGAAHALRFAAVYTDGGCDGMPDDLTYWADHAFQPNCYSPHCSDGRSDINIVAALQPQGCEVDVQLAQHRGYLVARCAPAAALLFGPAGGGGAGLEVESIPQAAASLAGWSSVGLERLFMDLYQDLALHQQQSTWGKLLLRDIPASQVPEEMLRLDEAAQRIEARQGRGLYCAVRQVPHEAVAAAARAARSALAAAGAGASLFATQQQQRRWQQEAQQCSRGLPARIAGVETPAAAAAAAATSVVSAAAVKAAGAGAAAADDDDDVEMDSKQAARHMYDSKQLEWFGQRSSSHITALVREVVVSRVGHFTCPLAAGALLLGQHPAGAASAATAAPGTTTSSSSISSSPQLHQVLALKHDPAAAALDGAATLDQVLAAVAAGQLPPILQQGEGRGVQWVEFEPLDAQQREARAQRGWYLRPVVWFRFYTPQRVELAGVVPAAAQQQQDVIDIASDSGEAPEVEAAAADTGSDADAHAEDAGPVVLEASSQEAQPGFATASSGSMEDTSEEDEETSPKLGQQLGGAAAGATAGSSDDEDDEEAAMLLSPGSAVVSSSVDAEYEDVDMEEEGAGGGHSSAAAAAAAAGHADFGGGAGGSSAVAAGLAAAGGSGGEAAADADMSDGEAGAAQEGTQQQQQVGLDAVVMVDAVLAAAAAAAAAEQPALPQQQQQQSQRGLGSGSSGCSSSARSAAWLGSGAPAVCICGPPSGLTEQVPDDAAVPQHQLLRMPLRGVHSGNVALLKLLSSENKMHEFEDPAEEPNIDIQCIMLRGLAVQLQEGFESGVTLL